MVTAKYLMMPHIDLPPPVSPGSLEEADARHLRDLYNGLQLDLSIRRQRDFLALARAWLLRYSTFRRLPLGTSLLIDISTTIDDATLAFIFIFGPRLWPSNSSMYSRAHLQEDAWLEYDWDAQWQVRTDELWDRELGASEGGYVRRWGSALRDNLRMYFTAVNEMRFVEEGFGMGDVDELFRRVVATEQQ